MFKKTSNEQKKTKYEKIELKVYIRPLLPKLIPRPSFQQRFFLFLHRYNLSLRAHLTSIDLKFSPNVTESWRFPVRVGFGTLPLATTDDIIKYVKKRPKTPNNNKKGGGHECVSSISC